MATWVDVEDRQTDLAIFDGFKRMRRVVPPERFETFPFSFPVVRNAELERTVVEAWEMPGDFQEESEPVYFSHSYGFDAPRDWRSRGRIAARSCGESVNV